MSTMRVYVGTYAKYNNGSIAGEWLDLEDYGDKEDFLDACAKLHEDEEDPELMFQDHEGIPGSLISESHISPDCWPLMEAFEQHGEDAVKAYLDCFSGEWDAFDFHDRYRGQFDSWKDMAEEFLEESGTLEAIPENLRNYFDYEAYARDIRLGGDMCEHGGHFFWNH